MYARLGKGSPCENKAAGKREKATKSGGTLIWIYDL